MNSKTCTTPQTALFMVCGFDSAEDFRQALQQPTLLVPAMDFGTDGCGHHGAMLQENIQYPPQLIEINPYEFTPVQVQWTPGNKVWYCLPARSGCVWYHVDGSERHFCGQT